MSRADGTGVGTPSVHLALIRRWCGGKNDRRLLHTLSVFSSPFLSESRTFDLLMCNNEASLQIVNDALNDEFTELLPPEA